MVTYIGAFAIIGFGVFMLLAAKIPRLNFENLFFQKKARGMAKGHVGYVASWVIGATFGAAWTPCVGPLLGSVLALAVSHPAEAYNSLLAYSIGLTLPFLMIGSFFAELTPVLRRIVKYTKYFDLVMGVVLILVGIGLLVGNQLGNV